MYEKYLVENLTDWLAQLKSHRLSIPAGKIEDGKRLRQYRTRQRRRNADEPIHERKLYQPDRK